MIINIVLFIFLIAGTILDLKKRSVPVILIIIFGGLALPLSCISGQIKNGAIWDELFGLLLGVVFIGISLISEGKLGMGDSLVILICGIYLGGHRSSLIVLYAMIASSLISFFMIVVKKRSGKTEIAFIPFLLSGFIIQLLEEIV